MNMVKIQIYFETPHKYWDYVLRRIVIEDPVCTIVLHGAEIKIKLLGSQKISGDLTLLGAEMKFGSPKVG